MVATTSKRSQTPQRKRFIEAAREAGASEDEAEFDKNLKRLATTKPASDDHATRRTKSPPKR
jgi:hypothetical protein